MHYEFYKLEYAEISNFGLYLKTMAILMDTLCIVSRVVVQLITVEQCEE